MERKSKPKAESALANEYGLTKRGKYLIKMAYRLAKKKRYD